MIEVVQSSVCPALTFKRGYGAHASRKHAHSQDSLSVVLAGRTEVEVGRARFALNTGEFVWIPAGMAHLCSPDRSESFAFAVLYLGGDVPHNPFAEVCEPRIGTVDAEWFQSLGEVVAHTDRLTGISPMIHRLRRIIDGAETVDAPLDQPDAIDLSSGFTGDVDGGRTYATDRYRRYRYFRARYSLGPGAVRQIHRVDRAIAMLQSGHSVSDVAAACGFYDQSHLVKTFRLYTGTVPSSYSMHR